MTVANGFAFKKESLNHPINTRIVLTTGFEIAGLKTIRQSCLFASNNIISVQVRSSQIIIL